MTFLVCGRRSGTRVVDGSKIVGGRVGSSVPHCTHAGISPTPYPTNPRSPVATMVVRSVSASAVTSRNARESCAAAAAAAASSCGLAGRSWPAGGGNGRRLVARAAAARAREAERGASTRTRRPRGAGRRGWQSLWLCPGVQSLWLCPVGGSRWRSAAGGGCGGRQPSPASHSWTSSRPRHRRQ